MKFVADRETMLRPLQLAASVVEPRQTHPILENLHVQAAKGGRIVLTGTDLEVELVAEVGSVQVEKAGETTIPARKLAEIWRSLPESAEISLEVGGDRAVLRSGRSRYSLATLSAEDFRIFEGESQETQIRLDCAEMRKLIDRVSFSMAQQDVRYFLNGMLLEVTGDHMRTVATDGHRLAMCTREEGIPETEKIQAIVPRKGVGEIARLMDESDGEVELSLGSNYLRVSQGAYKLTTKLIDGKFPDYERVIPGDLSRTITSDRNVLRQALQRAAILSNEKYRSVRLMAEGEQLTIQAKNPAQEEAEEIIAVAYEGNPMDIGFNVSYLQEVLSAVDGESVRLGVSEANDSAVMQAVGDDLSKYVVMPMRL